MSAKVVYIVGDIHADWNLFNEFIDQKIRKNPVLPVLAEEYGTLEVVILQVGDLAYYWPRYFNKGKIKNELSFAHDGVAKIYWIGGNHEDWDVIDSLSKDHAGEMMWQMDNGLIFCRFGATLDLTADVRVLFCGGAESIDKQYRLSKMAQGYHKIWWEQEGISDEDMERLKTVPKADWVISHTAPMLFNLSTWLADPGWKPKKEDNLSRYKLDDVFTKYRPQKWFFGHFHKYMRGEFEGCSWEGLADIASKELWWQSIRLS